MSKTNVLVNNPFLEEADDKFREVFFGSKPSAGSSNSTVSPAPVVEEKIVSKPIESPVQSTVTESPSKPVIKTNFVEDDSLIKKLERHNFKIYNTQINKLKTVAKHIRYIRGDEVKADMSSVLRYLIDSIDVDHMTDNFPKRY